MSNCIPSILKDTSFNEHDSAFIYQQLASAQNYKWKKNVVPGAKIINAQLYRKPRILFASKEEKRYGGAYHYVVFGVPIFSEDRNTVIFYKGEHCGGLCGGGDVTIYRKVNGKWEGFGTSYIWVS